MKTRRTPSDDFFSKLVRERAEHTCERCGKYCGPHHEEGRLDCSHIFSRRHKATRWHPQNAVAHCFTCHQFLGENPILFERWAREYLGDTILKEIELEHNRIVKCGKTLEKSIASELKSQYNRMLEQRLAGNTGRLPFKGYRFA